MADRNAKLKRSSAENKLRADAKRLQDACEGADDRTPSEQFLSRQIGVLEAGWKAFESAHQSYMELLEDEALAGEATYFANIYGVYAAAYEEGQGLIDSRRGPGEQTSQDERWNVLQAQRNLRFAKVEDMLANVGDYFKDKERTESMGTLNVQSDVLDRIEQVVTEAQGYSEEMVSLNPQQAVEILDGQKRVELGKEKRTTELRGIIAAMSASLLTLAAPPAVTSNEAPAYRGGGANYMYERRPLPKFGGMRRDYPSFRREWRESVTGKFPQEYELRELKRCVPAAVEPDIKNLRAVDAVWVVLDGRYGRVMELAKELVGGLQKFTYSKSAQTDSARFAELHREWTKVYNDLEEVDKLSTLDHEPTLANIAAALPGAGPKMEYVKLRLAMQKETAGGTVSHSELDIMKQFMKEEWDRHEYLVQLLGSEEPRSAPRQERDKAAPRQDRDKPKAMTCYGCGKDGHRKADCPNPRKFFGNSHANMKVAPKPCPVCKGQHFFLSDKGEKLYKTRLGGCPEFHNLSVSDRAAVVERAAGCALCLDFTGEHKRDKCGSKLKGAPWPGCDIMVGGAPCGAKHNQLLHGSTAKYCNMVQVNYARNTAAPTMDELEAGEARATLVQVQRIKVDADVEDVLTFWDSGSNISLVTAEFARRAKLQGRATQINLATTGRKADARDTMAYWVPLVDLHGQRHCVLAFEMEAITNEMEEVDVSAATSIFADIPNYEAVRRPSGTVELLVGIQDAGLHPSTANRGRHTVGNLRLLSSDFGTGYVLDGEHPDITAGRVMQTRESLSLGRVAMGGGASYSAAKKSQAEARSRICNRLAKQAGFQFPECEELGISQPRRCSSCSGCTRCSNVAQELSRREQEELAMFERNVHVDEERREVTIKYPLIKDPWLLTDNRGQAMAMTGGLERRLARTGQMDAYNAEIQGFVDRGVFVPLTQEEMLEWDGPVNYVSHHAVEKPQSATTPLRVVSNSSLNNNNSGNGYNDIQAKGPNSLVSLARALVRWRGYKHCVVWDLSKAFNTMKTFLEERHMRRLVWRWGKTNEEWSTFAIDRMHYGDRVATCGLEVGKRKVAQAGRHIDPAAAQMIEDGYVDDGIGGGESEDVDRLVGHEAWVESKPKYTGTISQILDIGGFKLKVMVRDGEERPDVTELLGGGVLGLPWHPGPDTIVMHLGVNLTQKKGGVRAGPELTIENIAQLETTIITRRVVVSQVYSIFDPLGLLSPLVLKFKLILQKLSTDAADWDDELDKELATESRAVLREIVRARDVTFPRSVMPEDAVGDAELCGWFDGGVPASAACLYVRYKKKQRAQDGRTHSVRLLMAKARVTPSAKGAEKLRRSTPRTELRGLVLLARMVTVSLTGLSQLPARISLMGDSECTISAVECEDGLLDVWFGNRVAEVLEHMEGWRAHGIQVDKLHHWPGLKNIADIATKGKANVEDVDEQSEWQLGPREASFPRSTWPASREFRRAVPEDERRAKVYNSSNVRRTGPGPKTDQPKSAGAGETEVSELFSLVRGVMDSSNKYDKVREVLARWLCARTCRDRDGVRQAPTVHYLDLAERLMFLVGSDETGQAIKKDHNKLIGLAPVWRRGRWVTRGRLEKGMFRVLGVSELPVLMPGSRLAELIMIKAHEEDHKSSTITLWRSRSKAWVWRGRGLANKVSKECIRCRARSAILLEQRMGGLPEERVAVGSKPFTYVCLDFLGPTVVKAMVNKRATMKVWPLVIVCQGTGALHTGVAHDYSTDAFLLQWDHFTALRGVPIKVVSDKGSQLTSARNIVAWGREREDPRVWDEVEERSARQGTSWEFVPAGAQFRNGLAEARVKAIKSTLEHMMNTTLSAGKPTLSYAELVTILAQAANIVNDRPIGAKVLTEGDIVPLTVNQLLLGRTSTSLAPGQGELEHGEARDLSAYSAYHDSLLNTWWSLWRQQGFPTLLPYERHKHEKRHINLKEGDVCLALYDNKVKNTYRLCRVVEVIKSVDGLVRTVRIGYRARRAGAAAAYKPALLTELEVAVQRLVLLVPEEELDAEEGGGA